MIKRSNDQNNCQLNVLSVNVVNAIGSYLRLKALDVFHNQKLSLKQLCDVLMLVFFLPQFKVAFGTAVIVV